jgi:hypothetical protein
VDQCALPRAGNPYDGERSPFGNFKIQPLDDLDPLAVLDKSFLKVLDLNHKIM